MKYEIIYDYCDDYTDERNIVEKFVGSWNELQETIRQMRKNGCFNISAGAISDEDDF